MRFPQGYSINCARPSLGTGIKSRHIDIDPTFIQLFFKAVYSTSIDREVFSDFSCIVGFLQCLNQKFSCFIVQQPLMGELFEIVFSSKGFPSCRISIPFFRQDSCKRICEERYVMDGAASVFHLCNGLAQTGRILLRIKWVESIRHRFLERCAALIFFRILLHLRVFIQGGNRLPVQDLCFDFGKFRVECISFCFEFRVFHLLVQKFIKVGHWKSSWYWSFFREHAALRSCRVRISGPFAGRWKN